MKYYIKVKLNNTSKECRITLLWSIWLEDAEFILSRRFFPPQILYTICLINEDNFPITYATKPVIFKVSRNLFDGYFFSGNHAGWFVITKSWSKVFGTTCVLFIECFAWKKVLIDLIVIVVTACFHILCLCMIYSRLSFLHVVLT